MYPGYAVGRSQIVFPSASRTTNQNGGDQDGSSFDFLHVIVDITTIGTGSITVTIQGKDPASGKYYTLLASAALVANATTVLRVGPALTAAANLVANDMIPSIWRVIVTANNANPVVYSVGANYG